MEQLVDVKVAALSCTGSHNDQITLHQILDGRSVEFWDPKTGEENTVVIGEETVDINDVEDYMRALNKKMTDEEGAALCDKYGVKHNDVKYFSFWVYAQAVASRACRRTAKTNYVIGFYRDMFLCFGTNKLKLLSENESEEVLRDFATGKQYKKYGDNVIKTKLGRFYERKGWGWAQKGNS
jgi:hypothetical protein